MNPAYFLNDLTFSEFHMYKQMQNKCLHATFVEYKNLKDYAPNAFSLEYNLNGLDIDESEGSFADHLIRYTKLISKLKFSLDFRDEMKEFSQNIENENDAKLYFIKSAIELSPQKTFERGGEGNSFAILATTYMRHFGFPTRLRFMNDNLFVETYTGIGPLELTWRQWFPHKGNMFVKPFQEQEDAENYEKVMWYILNEPLLRNLFTL
ncbi:MAG: hypothetical protein ABIF40_02220 [archaeon]